MKLLGVEVEFNERIDLERVEDYLRMNYLRVYLSQVIECRLDGVVKIRIGDHLEQRDEERVREDCLMSESDSSSEVTAEGDDPIVDGNVVDLKCCHLVFHPFVMKNEQEMLPRAQYEGLWENLYFDDPIKQDLLKYVQTIMLFSQKRVDHNIVSINRVVILYGPPGLLY